MATTLDSTDTVHFLSQLNINATYMTSTTETGKFKSSSLPHGTVEHCVWFCEQVFLIYLSAAGTNRNFYKTVSKKNSECF